MKQVAVIMEDKEFDAYIEKMKEKVKQHREDGKSRNWVLTWITVNLGNEDKYAFTGEQIKKVTDIAWKCE